MAPEKTTITVNLVKTNEIRKPNLGEYYFCSFCNGVELCKHSDVCPEGEIYLPE